MAKKRPRWPIVVQGLAKRFGEVVALDGIDFQVPAGSVFGLLGPTGAGKTTAIRILTLTTILRPDGGRAEILGLDVVGQAEEVRYRIGLAGQYAAIDPNLTGRDPSMDDVFLALTGRRAEAETAANGAGRGRCAADDRRTHHLLRAAVGGLVRGHPAGVRPRRGAALPPGRVELAPACAPARERSHPTEVPHERLHRRGA
jgi:ABC-type uncharacterized transport system ATPase subunit